MYQNVKPKVGHLFQSKLPKLGADLSSRTPPSRISSEYPHLTEIEALNITNMDTGEYLWRFGAILVTIREFKSRSGFNAFPCRRVVNFAEPTPKVARNEPKGASFALNMDYIQ